MSAGANYQSQPFATVAFSRLALLKAVSWLISVVEKATWTI
jgi:hypothetical protein